jgi:tryptophanyl-tRNA synthetase
MKRSLSGIKPTGNLTLGNYIGALMHFKDYQDQYENYIFVADLHALTMPIDPQFLHDNTKDIVAFYVAAGLDPKKTTIFLQSDVSAHAELNAIVQNYLYMGELARMTQYKEKSQKLNKNAIGLGLFAYPVLMAADIILYDADIVPVGEDQEQHVELCRTLVHRFNEKYKAEVFKMPKAEVPKVGARIMSLSDPTHKMSKSDPKGDIFLKDDLNVIRKKIMSAVTDMDNNIHFDQINKPGISNLMTIYACLKGVEIKDVEEEFKDCHRYGDFKKAVADEVISVMEPFQKKYREVLNSGEIDKILDDGAKRASKIADATLLRAKKAVGLYTHD